MKAVSRIIAVGLLTLGLTGCSDQPPLLKTTGDDYPEKLSEWRVHKISKQSLKLNDGVLPYDLNTPLFTDYASKLRTVWVPAGSSAKMVDGDIQYPVGTVITKTFYYPVDDHGHRNKVNASEGSAVLFTEKEGLPLEKVHLIETRVLVHQASGWMALPYVWNEQQSEATLEWAGESKPLELVHKNGQTESFTYMVPDANQCSGCHAPESYSKAIEPLGPKVRHLNRDFTYASGSENQLAYWEQQGILTGAGDPTVLPANTLWPHGREGESLNKRARSYLDANCSHCHNTKGPGNTSGLFLSMDTPPDTRLGLCKRPIAAGRGSGGFAVAIKPGHADESILTYRMQSKDPGAMMPELGRALVHGEGLEIVRQWINKMEPEC
ncbi:MAG: SO2930 family diheme c-type cytochrome [Endozoicomonas sp.]|uniref:SO2930 family diheme c-type cytochrome n=1 Tax=Endozoicomonas sp. TaxID=1892382 RepID=UPI003D9B37A3